MPFARIHVTVIAGARYNAVAFDDAGGIRVRIAAPAVEGKANRALVAFLADRLSVPPTAVRVVKGASNRHKTVEVDGLSEVDVRSRLTSPA